MPQPIPHDLVETRRVILAEGVALSVQLRHQGPGPVRLWLHGLGSVGGFWARNLPALTSGLDVVPDLPGFGESDPLPNLAQLPPAARLLALTDVLAQLLAALNLSQADWIGHSMGGQLALLSALRYPYRVNRLVLTAPAGIEPYTQPQIQTLDDLAGAGSGSLMPLRALRLLTLHLRAGQQTPPMDPRPASGAFGRQLLWLMQGMVHQPVRQHLRFVPHPTLLIMGQEDGLIPNRWFHPSLRPADVAQAAVAVLPAAHLALLPGGHFLPWEQAAAWNAIVADWLDAEVSRR